MRNLVGVALLLLCCTPGPNTIGIECDDVGNAICDRSVECGIVAKRSLCNVQSFKTSCCGSQGICDGPPSDPSSAEHCANDIRSDACTHLASNLVPGECASAVDVMNAFSANP